MNKKAKKDLKFGLSIAFACLAAGVYFTAVVFANTAGVVFNDGKLGMSIGYQFFTLVSIFFLIAEYVFFAAADKVKTIVLKLAVHDVFGLAWVFIWYKLYGVFDFEKKYMLTADVILKDVLLRKFGTFCIITAAAAAVCFLFASDKSSK